MLRSSVFLALVSLAVGHPLYDYVHRDDGCYKYEILESFRDEELGITTHSVNMSSQCWMDDTWSSQTEWFHYMAIVVPDTLVITDKAFIFIGQGNQNDGPIPEDDFILYFIQDISALTGSVGCLINQIPNQPITFRNDPRNKRRREDSLIAYTWMNWIRTPEKERNPDTMVLFAMAKGASMGMTTITNVVKERHGHDIEKFLVMGASKRGWTTVLVAAADERVIGMVPQVISIFNFRQNMHHHYQSLGGWSWAFKPYHDENLTHYLDSDVVSSLTYLIDPYEMAQNLTMPKLIVKSSMDEFFALDDFQHFVDDFGSGQQFLWVIDNSNHPMLGAWDRLARNVEAFFLTIHKGLDWPEFSYTMESNEETASVTVRCGERPLNVTAWYAPTPGSERRDWRFLIRTPGTDDREINDVLFYPDEVEDLGNFEYRVTYNAPEFGWIGFFITVEIEGPEPGIFFEFSSEANVVPNTFFYEDCEGAGCVGTIK